MLFPMITGIEEIKRVIELVESEKYLLRRKSISFDPELPLGIMVEVPATVTILDRMLKYAETIRQYMVAFISGKGIARQ